MESYLSSDSQLQDQIISLTDQRKSLHSQNVNLTGEASWGWAGAVGAQQAGCMPACMPSTPLPAAN